ncbi:MAG: hypothetical protein ABIP95_03665 [Pelobium sp.]
MGIRNKKRIVRNRYVHYKLKRRLIFFIILFMVMCGIMIYDIIFQKIDFLFALLAFAVGSGIGYVVGSIKKVKWAEEESMVISKMDKEGIIILILYLSFSLSRKWLFGHWIHGDTLSAFCFSLVAGTLLGRFLSTRIKIRKILKDQRYLVKPEKNKE